MLMKVDDEVLGAPEIGRVEGFNFAGVARQEPAGG